MKSQNVAHTVGTYKYIIQDSEAVNYCFLGGIHTRKSCLWFCHLSETCSIVVAQQSLMLYLSTLQILS